MYFSRECRRSSSDSGRNEDLQLVPVESIDFDMKLMQLWSKLVFPKHLNVVCCNFPKQKRNIIWVNNPLFHH